MDQNGDRRGFTIQSIQSNHEGTLIDWLHERHELLDLGVLDHTHGLHHRTRLAGLLDRPRGTEAKDERRA